MSDGPFGVRIPLIAESVIFNAAHPTATLLVEGGVDRRFWRMHCVCIIKDQGQGGRQSALAELDRARSHSEALIFAILDADFDRHAERIQARDDVIWTDGHDLETTLLCLPALEKLLTHLVDSEKLENQERRWNESIRSRLFRHAATFGRLRWIKLRDGIDALQFKKPARREIRLFDKYERCTGPDWQPSLLMTVNEICNYSTAHSLDKDDLMFRCNEDASPRDLSQFCNGHDLIGFLEAGLREVFRVAVSSGELTERLLLTVEHDWLRRTAMWQQLTEWELAHPGARVCRPSGNSGGGSGELSRVKEEGEHSGVSHSIVSASCDVELTDARSGEPDVTQLKM